MSNSRVITIRQSLVHSGIFKENQVTHPAKMHAEIVRPILREAIFLKSEFLSMAELKMVKTRMEVRIVSITTPIRGVMPGAKGVNSSVNIGLTHHLKATHHTDGAQQKGVGGGKGIQWRNTLQ